MERRIDRRAAGHMHVIVKIETHASAQRMNIITFEHESDEVKWYAIQNVPQLEWCV